MLLYYNNKQENAYHGYHEYQTIQNQQLAMVTMHDAMVTIATMGEVRSLDL